MSREIKFRAWDGKSVRYDVTGFEHGVGNEMAGVFLDGDYFSMIENKPLASHAVVMQYTGLKDKNGVEIYEGCVIKTDYYTGTPGKFKRIIGQVVYHAPSFVVEGVKKYEGLHKPLHGASEVLGNIYENPELVGGER